MLKVSARQAAILLGGSARVSTKLDTLQALGVPAQTKQKRRASKPIVPTAPLREAIEFVIPMRAFGKQSARHAAPGGDAQTYIPDRTRDKMKVIASEARLAMGWRRPHGGAFLVWITAEFAPPASWAEWARKKAIAGEFACVLKPDLDNICKTVLDAVKDIVASDDKFATDATLQKRWGEKDRIVLRFEASPLPIYSP